MGRAMLGLRTFGALALPYFRSQERWQARALLAGVICGELGYVFVAVTVIHWNARFFNALEARNWAAFQAELVVFCFITVGAIMVGMAQYFFGQNLLIRWRRFMTERYVALWMAEGRHYRIRFVDNTVDNIHLRIANDVLLFVQRTHELGTGLLNSFVALFSFAYILWGLSATTPVPLFGYDLAFPGYLIWAALAYAGIGTLVAHLIGRPLIRFNFNQQRYESDFRFAIARVTDQAEPVALMAGEAVERAELKRRFAALVRNWIALVARQTRLTGFVAGYGHVSTVFPILVVSPAYLSGAIPLGTLMQAHLAIQRVEGAFAFCIGVYAKIAEWKAVMERIAQFEAVMALVDERCHPNANIEVAPAAGHDLILQDVTMWLPSGEPIATLPPMRLAPGERVLVSGSSGSGKSTLFRTVAGLWPFGEGTVHLPQGARILALPQRPYFPLGTLKSALAYPMPADDVPDAVVREAIAAVGLSHLAERLDEAAEWPTVLSGGEQQRVGFARALIVRPQVLLLDEAVTTLDDEDGRELYRMLARELPKTILVSAGRPSALAAVHRRQIETRGTAATTSIGLALAGVPA
jgi:vitamin B12/bleomycin/antimicrobial peptide transport system ATP-binding/permease protein